MLFNQLTTILPKDWSFIINNQRLKGAKFDKMTLTTNEYKRVIHVYYSIYNTIL